MNINNLTIEEIKWLLGDYNKIRQFGKVSNWVDDHVNALRLLKGSWNKPSCNCEYAALARIANSVYEQFEPELKQKLVALETPVIDEPKPIAKSSRGRSKTNPKE